MQENLTGFLKCLFKNESINWMFPRYNLFSIPCKTSAIKSNFNRNALFKHDYLSFILNIIYPHMTS